MAFDLRMDYALGNLIVALLSFVTIIFIPVGFQFLKLARFSLTPFGYDFVQVKVTGFNTIVNVIWAVFLWLGNYAWAIY